MNGVENVSTWQRKVREEEEEMDRNRRRRTTMWCFDKVGLTPACLQTLLSCVVAWQLGGFPNDIMLYARVASTAATQPH